MRFGLSLGGGGAVGIAWEMAAIGETGVRCHTILGSERLDTEGLNLMDYASRPRGFEIGLAAGLAHASAVAGH